MTVSEPGEYRLGTAYAVPLMLFFTLVILFIALLQRQYELTTLSLVTVGIMLGAFIWSRASLRSTKFELGVERHHLFPGEQVQISLEVTNAKTLPIHVSVQTRLSDSAGSHRRTELKMRSSGLLGYQKAIFRWDPVAHQRGVHTIGPLQVHAGDPFGFFPIQTQIPAEYEIVVYPRSIPLERVDFARHDAFGAEGPFGHVRDPVLIQGARDYQASEPARHIHWKASARHRRLQTKVFASSYQEKSMFLLDASGFDREQDSADFEKILEVIASLTRQRDRQGCAIGLLTNSTLIGSSTGTLPPARNPGQLSMIMETLARCTGRADTDLLALLQNGTEIPWGSSCALFTRQYDHNAQLVKAFLKRRMLPVKVFAAAEALALCNGSASVDSSAGAIDENRQIR